MTGQTSTKKHPFGLYSLFATEFWERFSYYGMRGFFVLFLTAELATGGFGLEKTDAYIIYGVFTALVYLTPILGGMLADKLWGQRQTIYIGAILMMLGQVGLGMSVGSADVESSRLLYLYCGLGLLILGNGLFKANISTMVGQLYSPGDHNRDGGFSIFYMGINMGALIANFVAGSFAEKVGWEWGFYAAAIGMLICIFWFAGTERSVKNKDTHESVGMPPNTDTKHVFALQSKNWFQIISLSVLLSAVTIGICYAIFKIDAQIINTISLIVGLGLFAFLFILITKGTKGRVAWNRVSVIFVLAIFNIIFWSGFEQAGTSLNTFAADSTNRVVFGYEVPASWFQSINALFIVILAPLFSVIWSKLDEKKLNPRTPNKFGFSLIFLALGFFVAGVANDEASTGLLISPMWLVMVYLLHTIGELCMSPIGLSMITKLSPPKITSVMMGTWFASIALGNYLAAAMTSISGKFDIPTFYFIAGYAAVSAALAFLIAPVLNRLMKGVH